MTYSVNQVRADFPALDRVINGWPLAYLDSANTAQKPQPVIETVADFASQHSANVARAMHTLGLEATAAYEAARAKVAAFIDADSSQEIIFTKNATEALNLAAHCLGESLQPGDEVVISVMEHHSNIVPWQMACQRSGAHLRWFDITADGQLDLVRAQGEQLINQATKIVAITWVSNVLGTVNPIAEIAAQAHAVGATVVVDAAQGVPHRLTSVRQLGADLLAFTGHKLGAPTGIGVLWGRGQLLESLPPFLGGGEMIETVQMEASTYAAPPARFEAGTPPIMQAVGLGAAIDYLEAIGMTEIARHESAITGYALKCLSVIEGLHILGPGLIDDRGGAISFTVDDLHPHDLMQLLDARWVAVRGGHHCARPLHQRLGLSASTRASIGLYTTTSEVDQLSEAIVWARDFLTRPTEKGQ